jgi:8-oxo-dGTP pyrophosphatase MutT (NUDIX family)
VTLSIRYQGAIIRDHHILLLKQIEHASGRSYWQIPGGGIEPDETEEQCVQRGCPLGHAGGDRTVCAD